MVPCSNVLWGGVDPRLYNGSIVWFPVIGNEYWPLEVLEFAIGDHVFDMVTDTNALFPAVGLDNDVHAGNGGSSRSRGSLLVVDSGTTFCTATGTVYDAIHRSIKPMRCSLISQLPTLTYTIKGVEGKPHKLALTPDQYMVRDSGFAESYCVPGLVKMDFAADERPIMILGEVFMRHYLTVFNRGGSGHGDGPRVGFAHALGDEGAYSFLLEAENQRSG